MVKRQGKKFLVFDFDDTITKHGNGPSALFLHQPFLSAIEKQTKNGSVICVIATFSTPDRVYEFLEKHNLLGMFKGIYSTNEFENGKNKILKTIGADFSTNKKDMVLIDNDKTNIKKASKEGYATIQVDTDGLVKNDFLRIKKFLSV